MKTLVIIVTAMATIFILSSPSFSASPKASQTLTTPLIYSSASQYMNSMTGIIIANQGSSSVDVTFEICGAVSNDNMIFCDTNGPVTVAAGQIYMSGTLLVACKYTACVDFVRFTFPSGTSGVQAGATTFGGDLFMAK